MSQIPTMLNNHLFILENKSFSYIVHGQLFKLKFILFVPISQKYFFAQIE